MVVVAVGVAVLLRVFVVQTLSIPLGSMMPTLDIGDRIVVDKLGYDLHGVGRGDIVVFARPPAEDSPERRCPSGHALIGRPVRPTPCPETVTSLSTGSGWTRPGFHDPTRHDVPRPLRQSLQLATPVQDPRQPLLMMGDNRGDSCDSRFWGTIPESLIVGKVDLRIWPLSRFHFF